MRRKWFSLYLSLVLVGCTAGGPATGDNAGNNDPDDTGANPPAPPTELPQALVFPESVAINVDTIRSEEGSNQALVGSGGAFSEAIAAGADLTHQLNTLVDEILGHLDDMEIPVSEATTTLTRSNGATEVKIDFADFDFDGDGEKEGCSGHTAAIPICFRVWLNEQRLMAGLFTQFPTADNAGAGDFLVIPPPGGDMGASDDFRVRIRYDHSDSEDKTTELFFRGTAQDSFGGTFSAHALLTQEGPEASAKKRISMHFLQSATEEIEYVGQWQEGEDYWSGALRIHFTDLEAETCGVCAVIATGDPTVIANCKNLDIAVTACDFIATATDEDVAIPADFPETPTF